MRISSPYYNYSFGTCAKSYVDDAGKPCGTMTCMFREDLDWQEFSKLLIKYSQNKDRVNIVQCASSDGSEAYSLLLLLQKYSKNIEKFTPIQAYDIDDEIINIAKNGFLNLNSSDIYSMIEQNVPVGKNISHTNPVYAGDDIYNPNRYTNLTDKSFCTSTYKVSPELASKVNFHKKDMFDVVNELKDNSNTVLMCRNVIGDFSDVKKDRFLELVSKKLNKGSLFAVGFHETKDTDFDRIMYFKGFKPVMENVYLKYRN